MIEIDPRAAAFNNRGWTYDKKGDHDRAIADYDEALRLDPHDAVAFTNRGFAYGNKGDYARAIADYNEAIRLDPQNETIRNLRDQAEAAARGK